MMNDDEPLFKQLNMLKLEDLLKLQQLKFYFKFNEGSLPVYLQNWDITPNAHVHDYNTRELGCMHTFKVKHEFAQKNQILFAKTYKRHSPAEMILSVF